MKWLNNLPEWILGIIGIVVFIVIVVLVGDVYRKFQSLWVCLWFSIPIMAYIISTRRLDAHLTEKGMKSLRVWLMVFAVGMSFIIFFDYDLKAKFGHYFFKGSKFWAADLGDEDDYGNPVLSHEYFAPTAWGRFVLGAYDWVKLGLCILIPCILYGSFERSINAKERERYEQERLEYIRDNPPD